MRRLALLFAVGFASGLTLAACSGTTTTCSPSTCGGCCDSTGLCKPGVTADACGVDGETCGRCGSGTTCSQGACTASGTGGGGGGGGGSSGGGGGATGGGGGSTGGGGGSTGGGGGAATGGGSGSCRVVSSFGTESYKALEAGYLSFTQGVGHYHLVRWAQPVGTSADVLALEVVYPNDAPTPAAPFTQAIAAVGYRACTVCAVFYDDCTGQPLRCGKTYLAQAGTVSMSELTRATEGRMTGSASNLRFVEWNLGTDVAVSNGACVEVARVEPFTLAWSADGGIGP